MFAGLTLAINSALVDELVMVVLSLDLKAMVPPV
jgi:hypothetical protein